ncbi:hypothetical protein A8U91_01697 [Halomonas elongata]|uniref:Uncharacterized protein n=1 Tax=Halomonas elongata TaxID=2746 RepID=A0A1B8P500_HALEL|nr:hypothetical protein A8U91_01697 [Halomonas elongata]
MSLFATLGRAAALALLLVAGPALADIAPVTPSVIRPRKLPTP